MARCRACWSLWTRPRHAHARGGRALGAAEIAALLRSVPTRSARQAEPARAARRRGTAATGAGCSSSQSPGPARDCVESGPCAEWLGDLRLLGMRPRSWSPQTSTASSRRLMAVAVVLFAAALAVDRLRARATARRSRCSAPSLLLLTQTIEPGRGDRGDRLEHARPARRDDADGQASPSRRASTRGSRSAPASSRAAGRCAVVVSLAGTTARAVGVPGQPHDGAADGADHVPARRRARHRPDPAGHHRDHRLQHRRHRDADRRPAEHPHRRRHRPVVHARSSSTSRRSRSSPSSWSPAGLYLAFRAPAADRARGARARDGARRAPLDRGHGRAQAHRADPGRHDPAVLRPPGRCTSSPPRSP